MKTFTVTFGTGIRPITPASLRASVCLAALVQGLRPEMVSAFPGANMIEITGEVHELKRLCETAFRGARFVESDKVDQNGHKWWTIYSDAGHNPSGIVKRGDVWAIYV